MPKITIYKLRKLIAEEIRTLKEGELEDSAAKMGYEAAKLLKAIESFSNSASMKVKQEDNFIKHLNVVQKVLKRVIQGPTTFVDAIKPVTAEPVAATNIKPNIVTSTGPSIEK